MDPVVVVNVEPEVVTTSVRADVVIAELAEEATPPPTLAVDAEEDAALALEPDEEAAELPRRSIKAAGQHWLEIRER